MSRKIKIWSDQEINFLIEGNKTGMLFTEIAESLGINVKLVYYKAQSLGLKCNTIVFREHFKKRASENELFQKNQFKKNHAAWNKGMIGLQIGGVESQFKKGHQPHNTKYDNCISIRYTKGRPYKHIRVGLGKWVLLHRKIWIDAYGIPEKNQIIYFKDGDSMNCELSNLAIMNRKDNMNRNSITRFPDELQDAYRAMIVLKSHITRLEKR